MANPNPSPGTRFKPGECPNPGGKTKEQRKLEVEAAEMAARLRHKMLSELSELVEASSGASVQMISSDVLRLLKDSEDRAFGSPKQSVAHGEDPENPLPATITLSIVKASGES